MKVSAIVPAHNEAPRIRCVLETLHDTPGITEIIVVDDGSTDGTGDVARSCGVRVIRSESREGKGQALEKGVRESGADILFFCDADIQNLTPAIVSEIVAPVLSDSVEMSIGARASKERRLLWIRYSMLLDGQRALTKKLWVRVPARFKRGYRIEAALNHCARSYLHRLYPITQRTKEEKAGLCAGTFARFAMYAEITFARILLALKIQ